MKAVVSRFVSMLLASTLGFSFATTNVELFASASSNELTMNAKNDISKVSTEYFFDSEMLDADYTGDGKISISDAVILVRILAEDSSVTYARLADPNMDGEIDGSDIVAILKFLVHAVNKEAYLDETVVTTTDAATTTTTTIMPTATTAKTTITTPTTTTETTTTTILTTTTETSTTTTPTTTTETSTTTTPATTTETSTTTTPTTTTETSTTTTPATTTETSTTTTPTTTTETTTTTTLTTTTETSTTTTPTTTTETSTTATPTTTTETTTMTASTTTTETSTTTTPTTTTETTTTTTLTTTTETSATTTPATTTETQEDSRELIVTDPNGAIIPRKTYETLVEYAKENEIDEYDVIWTGGQLMDNSVIVLEYKSINSYFCKGAFQIMRGKKFLEMVRQYLDEDWDFMEISDLENIEYVAWRHCDKKYLQENPDNILSGFDSDQTDIKYFKWSQYEDEIYWALIPKEVS